MNSQPSSSTAVEPLDRQHELHELRAKLIRLEQENENLRGLLAENGKEESSKATDGDGGSRRNHLDSQTKLEVALASMSDAMVIVDSEGKVVECSQALATFHKFGSMEEFGFLLAKYPDLVEGLTADGSTLPVEQWPILRALRGESASNVEILCRRKDTGETWYGSFSFNPIIERDGVISGAMLVARDITEKKRQEEELRRANERLLIAQWAARAGVWEWDVRAESFFWSPGFDSYARKLLI